MGQKFGWILDEGGITLETSIYPSHYLLSELSQKYSHGKIENGVPVGLSLSDTGTNTYGG
jgi:hypothetical protein